MKTTLKRFLSDEAGAITVDWVVLTAATVGLGVTAIAILASVNGGVGQNIGNGLAEAEVQELDLYPTPADD